MDRINFASPELLIIFGSIFGHLVLMISNILIIVIGSFGYKLKKSVGWLLLLIFGCANLLTEFLGLFGTFGTRFLSTGMLGRSMYAYTMVSTLFSIGSPVLLVSGLFMLLKEYKEKIGKNGDTL